MLLQHPRVCIGSFSQQQRIPQTKVSNKIQIAGQKKKKKKNKHQPWEFMDSKKCLRHQLLMDLPVETQCNCYIIFSSKSLEIIYTYLLNLSFYMTKITWLYCPMTFFFLNVHVLAICIARSKRLIEADRATCIFHYKN